MPADDLDPIEQAVIAAFEGWDSVPTREISRAQAIFELRSVDAELAELVDAADGQLVGARAESDEPETLTFQVGAEVGAGSVAIEINIDIVSDGDGPEVQLAGQCVPPAPGRIVVERGDQLEPDVPPIDTQTDTLGRFSVRILRGIVRLRLTLAESSAVVVTEFFRA